MVRNREEAAKLAESTQFNIPDSCQLTTRGWFDAPSVGDFDGDGAADAEDGWKSEPVAGRHSDRKPPRGTPTSWLGGSKDNGHRAISLGPNDKGVYMIRSTDAGGRGKCATVPLDWPELNWGLQYVGWTPTIDGILIPLPPAVVTRGRRVDEAIAELRAAKGKGDRSKAIDLALEKLLAIEPLGGN